jgi:hypothetical protein
MALETWKHAGCPQVSPSFKIVGVGVFVGDVFDEEHEEDVVS